MSAIECRLRYAQRYLYIHSHGLLGASTAAISVVFKGTLQEVSGLT